MTRIQFRVLYREFLFRMVDIELLSSAAQGDVSKLLGQFATLLIFLSLLLALAALGFGGSRMPTQARLIATWSIEHFLIATTMLVVGLFAVLSWDSTFPNRRDVLVLAPLPVRARTLFLAKVAAAGTALGLTVAALHVFAGLTWPPVLAPAHSGVVGLIRSLAAYWITMLAAGGFIFCCVLGVQGLAQILPRKWFLRVSSFLQLAAFCLFLSVYFLQPSLATPEALTNPENQRMLAWLPSYWFLGMFQELNGSMHMALAPLARRAWIGLGVAGWTTTVAYLLSYFHTLRKIVEEPDILPGSRGLHWLPRFGNSLETAVVQFSVRTLLRSRQHRVILAFYLGIGFAIAIFFLKTPLAQQQLSAASAGGPWHQASVPLLAASIVMMGFCIVGTRVVFAMPLDPRANWIFRVTPVRGGPECLAVRRRSLFALAVVPVWAGSAALFLSLWPWRPAVAHLMVLGLLCVILGELCLSGTQKIPFTCSYLPGKSNIHLTFWICIGLLVQIIDLGAKFERRALDIPEHYGVLVGVLGIAAIGTRWRTAAQAASDEAELQFEDVPPPTILALGLNRDGVVPMETDRSGD